MQPSLPADPARPRARRLRLAVIALVAIAAGVYATAVVRLMTQETELIFRTGAARADTQPPFPYERVDLPRNDGARQFAWRMESGSIDGRDPGSAPTWVLYLHGNASTVASRMIYLASIRPNRRRYRATSSLT